MWSVHFVLQHGAPSGFLINSMRLPEVDSDYVNLSVYAATLTLSFGDPTSLRNFGRIVLGCLETELYK